MRQHTIMRKSNNNTGAIATVIALMLTLAIAVVAIFTAVSTKEQLKTSQANYNKMFIHRNWKSLI